MPPPDVPLPDNSPEGEITRYLNRLRNGDREAINLLLEHTYKRFRGLARRMLRGFPALRGELETDDLLNKSVLALQEILLAEVERVLAEDARAPTSSTRTPTSSTHLFRFAARKMRHQLINLVRRVRLQPGADSGLDRVPGAPTDPEVLLRRSEIHEAVDRLDERLQAVVDLCVYQGLKHEAIAEELGISVKTVGRDWWEAQRRLREYLGGGEQ